MKLLSCLALLLIALSAVNAQANLRFVHGVQGAPAVDVYFNTVAQNNLVFSNIPPLFVTNFANLPAIATIVDGQQAVQIIVTIAGTANVVVIQSLNLANRNPVPGGIGGGLSTTGGGTFKPQAFTSILQLDAQGATAVLNILVDPLVLTPPANSAVIRLVMVGGLTNFPTMSSKLTEAQTELVDLGLPGGTIVVGGVNIFDQVFERFVVPANTTQLLIFPSRGPVLQPEVNPLENNPPAEGAIPGLVDIPFGQRPSQVAAGAQQQQGQQQQGQQGQQQQQGEQGQQQQSAQQQGVQAGGEVGGVGAAAVIVTRQTQIPLRPISVIGNLKLIGGRSYTIFALGEQLTIISAVQALDPNAEVVPVVTQSATQPATQTATQTQSQTATEAATAATTAAAAANVTSPVVVVLQRPVVTSSAISLKFDSAVLAMIAAVLFALLG